MHKVEALNNIDLSEYWWIHLLGSHRPIPPEGSSAFVKFGYALYREWLGIALVIGYLTVIPPFLVVASKYFQHMFVRMGFIRYMVMTNLLLMMMLLPLKMVARWTVNMKYFISLPEYMLNF